MLGSPTHRYRVKSPPPHVLPSSHYAHRRQHSSGSAYSHSSPRTRLRSPPPHTLPSSAVQTLPSIHWLGPPPLVSPKPQRLHRPAHTRKSSDLSAFSFTSRDADRRGSSPYRYNPYRSPPRTADSHPFVKQEPLDYFHWPAEHKPAIPSLGHYLDDPPLTPLSARFASPTMSGVTYKWPSGEDDSDKWPPIDGESDIPTQAEQKSDNPALDPALSSIRQSSDNVDVAAAAAEAVAAAAAASASADQDITMASAPEIRLPETLGSASASPAIHAETSTGNDHSNNNGLSVPEKKDTPFSRSPELRVSHKLAERKRRKEMRDLFDELREQLPADRGMKASKWEILSKAVDYIQALKTQVTDASRTIEMLHRDLALARGETPGNPQPWASSYHNFNLPYVPHAAPAQTANAAASQQQATVPQAAAQPAPVVQQQATQPAQPAPQAATQNATSATQPQQPAQTAVQPAAEPAKADS